MDQENQATSDNSLLNNPSLDSSLSSSSSFNPSLDDSSSNNPLVEDSSSLDSSSPNDFPLDSHKLDAKEDSSRLGLSSYDNSNDLRDNKNNKTPWRTASFLLIALLVILTGVIVFFYFYSNKKLSESTDQIKHYQKELADSKTVISQYESATQTKVVDVKDQTDLKEGEKPSDDKNNDKQIVKWNDLNINFGQLVSLIGDNFRIRNGRIVTNNDGTMVVAKISINPLEKQSDPNGLAEPSFIDHGMGGQSNVYIRKLPSGSWQYIGVFTANGMGAIECKNVSEEMKKAATVLNQYETDPNMRYSCVTYKDNNHRSFEKTVF